MGPMLSRNCQSTLRNISEEQISHIRRNRSPKSCTAVVCYDWGQPRQNSEWPVFGPISEPWATENRAAAVVIPAKWSMSQLSNDSQCTGPGVTAPSLQHTSQIYIVAPMTPVHRLKPYSSYSLLLYPTVQIPMSQQTQPLVFPENILCMVGISKSLRKSCKFLPEKTASHTRRWKYLLSHHLESYKPIPPRILRWTNGTF
jgi:hypothetical protein